MKKEAPPLEYETPRPQTQVRVGSLLGAIFSPTLVTAAVLTACDWPTRHWFTDGLESSPAIEIWSLCAGLIFLWRARLPSRSFYIAIVPYLLLLLVWIIVFGIYFESAVLGIHP